MKLKQKICIVVGLLMLCIFQPTLYGADIRFKKDEYIRIAQPVIKDNLITFDSQINIIGEAREGLDITIQVYENLETDEDPVTYTVKKVGATQTFNQLIDLKEGNNVVAIQYVYVADKKESPLSGVMYFTINRKPEKTKQLMINYRVGQGEVTSEIKK
jgi:hypothetical protein